MGDPAAVPQATEASRALTVRNFGDDRRTVEIGPGDAALLMISENHNSGWTATLSGRRLEAVQVDGWRHGWIVPAGQGGTIQLEFQAATAYRWLLVIGCLLVLGLAAMALVRSDVGDPPLGPRRIGPLVSAIVIVLVGLLAGGVTGLVFAAFALLLRGRVSFPAVAAVAFLVAGSLAAMGAPALPADSSGTFGVAAQVAALVAVVAVAATLGTDEPPP
jgi:arabinofuranan 3-O-arabinosyltransferase